MTDPKEALERLKKFVGPAPYTGESGYDVYPGGIFCKDGPNEFYADIRALIAKQEGLEREVARLTKERDDARRIAMAERNMCDSVMRYRDEYLARAEAAESKFAELKALYDHSCAAKAEMRDDLEAAEAKLSALEGAARGVIADLKGWDAAEELNGAKAYKTPRAAYREAAAILELALLDRTAPVEAEPVKRFWYLECPSCEWDTVVGPKPAEMGLTCPICAGDSGRDVYLLGREATAEDKPEGPDDRIYVAVPVQDVAGLVDYTAMSFADLQTVIGRLEPDFPNFADWSVSLPAGHWRAISAALSPVPPSQGAGTDMRKVVEALGFEPDNHHNALKCPYCNPAGLTFIQPHPDEGKR